MKKILILFLILLSTTLSYAAKTTTYIGYKDAKITITFNKVEMVTVKDLGNPAGNQYKKAFYIPVFIQGSAIAITEDGATKQVIIEKKIGELSETPVTLREAYGLLPSDIQITLKDVVLQGTGEDISVPE